MTIFTGFPLSRIRDRIQTERNAAGEPMLALSG
jgi:hypothetical protein